MSAAPIQKTPEPSMEDILASIRRIISDDQDFGRNAAAKLSPRLEPQAAETHESDAYDDEEDEDDVFADYEEPVQEAAQQHEEPAAATEQPDVAAATEEPDLRQAELQPEPASAPAAEWHEPTPRYEASAPVAPALAQPEPARFAVSQPDIRHEPHTDLSEARSSMQAQPQALAQPDAIDPASLISDTTGNAVGQAFNSLAHTVLSKNARTLEDLVKEMLRPMLKVWLDDNLPPLVERLVRAEIERVARGAP